MTRVEFEELAALDAVGALLDADARAAYRARLAAATAEERAAVAALYAAARSLAEALVPVEPPPALRERLLAQVSAAARVSSIRPGRWPWQPSAVPGVRLKVLNVDRARGTATLLVRLDPGAVYPAHHHSGPEECFVVSGDVRIGGERLTAGDFHHADGDTEHGVVTSERGAELLLVVEAADYLRSI